LQAASIHKELVLWLRTSNPSDTPFRVLRVSVVECIVGCHRGSEIQVWSGTLLGFALLGYLPIVARISFVRLSKSSRKT
jgi:hypothetical protein